MKVVTDSKWDTNWTNFHESLYLFRENSSNSCQSCDGFKMGHELGEFFTNPYISFVKIRPIRVKVVTDSKWDTNWTNFHESLYLFRENSSNSCPILNLS